MPLVCARETIELGREEERGHAWPIKNGGGGGENDVESAQRARDREAKRGECFFSAGVAAGETRRKVQRSFRIQLERVLKGGGGEAVKEGGRYRATIRTHSAPSTGTERGGGRGQFSLDRGLGYTEAPPKVVELQLGKREREGKTLSCACPPGRSVGLDELTEVEKRGRRRGSATRGKIIKT